MKSFLMAALLFLTANSTLADVKNKEKAKFDLISSIEVMVNIEECRKSVREDPEATILPRVCNRLEFLSKYFFAPKKDKEAIYEFLNNEEERVTSNALKLVDTYKFKKLGKMTLSEKCVKNKDPMDLDLYLNKIKGIPVPHEEEFRNPAQEDL